MNQSKHNGMVAYEKRKTVAYTRQGNVVITPFGLNFLSIASDREEIEKHERIHQANYDNTHAPKSDDKHFKLLKEADSIVREYFENNLGL